MERSTAHRSLNFFVFPLEEIDLAKQNSWTQPYVSVAFLSPQDKQGLCCSLADILVMPTFILLWYALPAPFFFFFFLLCHLPPNLRTWPAERRVGGRERGKKGGVLLLERSCTPEGPRKVERWIKENKYYVSTQLHLYKRRSSARLCETVWVRWDHSFGEE